MAFGSTSINAFGGAARDILGGIATSESLSLKAEGDAAEGQNYRLAAALAGENEQYTEQSTAVQEAQTRRQVYQSLGTTTAQIGAAGFQTNSGSALDILRSSTQQGGLQAALQAQQGGITEEGFKEQQKSFTTLANYADMASREEDSMASSAEISGFITGGISALAGIAAL